MALDKAVETKAGLYKVVPQGDIPDRLIISETVKESSRRMIRPALAIERIMVHKIPSWKRFLDIGGSLFGIALLSPLFLIHYIIMKVVSPGAIFFKQERVGELGKVFNIYKFRTMKVNCDVSDHREYVKDLITDDDDDEKPMIKQEDNANIIPGTKILRKSAFDELPQLINVLIGDMSLVGPRPCIPYEAEEYLRWHTKRFLIKPGMTGLWQVSGKNNLTFKQMIRFDIQYQKKLSLMFDLKLLFLTLPTLVIQILENKLPNKKSSKKEYEPVVSI